LLGIPRPSKKKKNPLGQLLCYRAKRSSKGESGSGQSSVDMESNKNIMDNTIESNPSYHNDTTKEISDVESSRNESTPIKKSKKYDRPRPAEPNLAQVHRHFTKERSPRSWLSVAATIQAVRAIIPTRDVATYYFELRKEIDIDLESSQTWEASLIERMQAELEALDTSWMQELSSSFSKEVRLPEYEKMTIKTTDELPLLQEEVIEDRIEVQPESLLQTDNPLDNQRPQPEEQEVQTIGDEDQDTPNTEIDLSRLTPEQREEFQKFKKQAEAVSETLDRKITEEKKDWEAERAAMVQHGAKYSSEQVSTDGALKVFMEYPWKPSWKVKWTSLVYTPLKETKEQAPTFRGDPTKYAFFKKYFFENVHSNGSLSLTQKSLTLTELISTRVKETVGAFLTDKLEAYAQVLDQLDEIYEKDSAQTFMKQLQRLNSFDGTTKTLSELKFIASRAKWEIVDKNDAERFVCESLKKCGSLASLFAHQFPTNADRTIDNLIKLYSTQYRLLSQIELVAAPHEHQQRYNNSSYGHRRRHGESSYEHKRQGYRNNYAIQHSPTEETEFSPDDERDLVEAYTLFGQQGTWNDKQWTDNQEVCPMHKLKHKLIYCPAFRHDILPAQRLDIVKKEGRCMRCISPFHTTKECRRQNRPNCFRCNSHEHHHLLHIEEKQTHYININDAGTVCQVSNKTQGQLRRNKVTLLQIPIRIRNPANNKAEEIYVIIDSGSTATFLDSSLMSRLGLRGVPQEIRTKGVGGIDYTGYVTNTMVALESIDGSIKQQVPVKFSYQPTGDLKYVDWNRYKDRFPELSDIQLPQPTKPISTKVLGILGNDLKFITRLDQSYNGRPQIGGDGYMKPMAQKTLLGWAISGFNSTEPPTTQEFIDGSVALNNTAMHVFVLPPTNESDKDIASQEMNKNQEGENATKKDACNRTSTIHDKEECSKTTRKNTSFVSDSIRKDPTRFHNTYDVGTNSKITGDSIEATQGKQCNNSICRNTQKETMKNLYRLFDIDRWENDDKQLTVDELRTTQIFEETFGRAPSGKCRSGTAWRLGEPDLPANYKECENVYCNNEKSWIKNNTKYFVDEEMQKLLDKGFIKELPNTSENRAGFFLPQFLVVNEKKTTTKMRMVLNAKHRFRHKQGRKSLNDCICDSPNVIQELLQVLLRSRYEPILIAGDVTSMFLQLECLEADKQFLKVMWRSGTDQNAPMRIFAFQCHLFGKKDSPYQAIQTILTQATKHKHQFPQAFESITKSVLVDDLMDSRATIEEAEAVMVQVKKLLNEHCGMNMRKWLSSNRTLTEKIPQEDRAPDIVIDGIEKGDGSMVRALGLVYRTMTDCYTFKYDFTTPKKWTKRNILSIMSKIFDPMGLVSPYTVYGKLLYQDICLKHENAAWDTTIPKEDTKRFDAWMKDASQMNDIQIKRCLLRHKDETLQQPTTNVRKELKQQIKNSFVNGFIKSTAELDLLSWMERSEEAETQRDNDEMAFSIQVEDDLEAGSEAGPYKVGDKNDIEEDHKFVVLSRQYHIFADASKDAYGACAYQLTHYLHGTATVRMTHAKGRIAPKNLSNKTRGNSAATTIPRLELCAAVTGVQVAVQLAQYFELDLKEKIGKEHVFTFWSDSTVALFWIKTQKPKKVFVENRVRKIREKVSPEQWRHCPGEANPADVVSRGETTVKALKDNKIWWEGPNFLKLPHIYWPKRLTEADLSTNLELKPGQNQTENDSETAVNSQPMPQIREENNNDAIDLELLNVVNYTFFQKTTQAQTPFDKNFSPLWHPERFNSLWQFIQCTAVMLTFRNKAMALVERVRRNKKAAKQDHKRLQRRVKDAFEKRAEARKRNNKLLVDYYTKRMKGVDQPVNLESEELFLEIDTGHEYTREILDEVIRKEQRRFYGKEVSCLEKGKDVPKKSRLSKYAPELDKKTRLMKVYGRFQRENLKRSLVVLPPDSALTRLVVKDVHTRRLHHVGGRDWLFQHVKETYFTFNLRRVVNKVLERCYRCRTRFPVPFEQRMAPLHVYRTPGVEGGTESPFAFGGSVSVDTAGPFKVSRGQRRSKELKHVLVFACGSTRAVHFEIIDSLDTSDCLVGFLLFLNRRGAPQTFVSDRARAFVRTEKEVSLLRTAMKNVKDKIDKDLHDFPTIKWEFTTARSSHSNGAVERLIGTMKRSLKTVAAINPKKGDLTEKEFSLLLSRVESIMNSRPLTKDWSQELSEETMLTPNHFVAGNNSAVKLTIPREVLDNGEHENEYNYRWRLIERCLAEYWRRWWQDYSETLRRYPRWQNGTPPIKKGQIVLVLDKNKVTGNNTEERLKWPMAQVTDYTKDSSGLIQCVKLRFRGVEVTRNIRDLAPIPCLNDDDSHIESSRSNEH